MGVRLTISEPVVPRNLAYVVLAILVSTDAFLLVCTFIEEIDTPLWMFFASSAIFAIAIAAVFILKLKITIENDILTVKVLKKIEIPFESIMDHRIGDIERIKNYSEWGFKGVKYYNFICLGIYRGVTLKLLGKRIVTISVVDPESFVSVIIKTEE